MLKITLVAKPEEKSLQFKFEKKMFKQGLHRGSLAIDCEENKYCNGAINTMWNTYKQKQSAEGTK